MYWGSWKGRVIRAIAIEGARTWNEIRDRTGLSPKSLNKVLSELFDAEAIEKRGENEYRVAYELYKKYREYFESLDSADTLSQVEVTQDEQKSLVSWMDQWRDAMGLDFSLKPEHFYLQGDNLSTFSIKLIEKSRREVFVVNPFVDECSLGDTLWKAADRGVKVTLVTRPPSDRAYEYLRRKREDYLDTLKKYGVKVVNNRRVHAKLIVVDRAVAVVSSMNFYSGSTAGESWEAGLVTKNDMVVESIVGSILELLERKENL